LTIEVGQAFLIPSGTSHNPDVKHMFVVCTSIDDNGNVVLASISSWKNDLCDATCKLAAGSHPFIKKDSYVLYRQSRIENTKTIERGLSSAVFVALDDVTDEVLAKIVAGLTRSRQTPWQIKRHIKRLLGTKPSD
jgi:hypothetical protein